MNQPSRVLLSFTTTVMRLSKGDLQWSDLDSSLWFFGCSRSHALGTEGIAVTNEWYWIYSGVGLKGDSATAEQRNLVTARTKAFVTYLLRAEEEKRCAWTSEVRDGQYDERTWKTLETLVALWRPEAYGLLQVSGAYEPPPRTVYNYPSAASYVRQFGLNSIPESL